MSPEMTDEEKNRFIAVAQMGMACGLEHPYEWLNNFLSHSMNMFEYSQIAAEERKTLEAFVAFMRGTGSCPDDPIETITAEGLLKLINAWYERPRNQQ